MCSKKIQTKWQFFWYILGLCTTELQFSDLKKKKNQAGNDPFEEKSIFMTTSSNHPPFWNFEKKI
jgi:hypothetical protein